jgi:formate/nitrite transporter FocA (FNT family)
MDYVKPPDQAAALLGAAAVKVNLPVRHVIVRAMLAGAYLAVATSMAITAAVQTKLPIIGALIFPFGLCLVILLGTELITGSFAVTPAAAYEGKPGGTWGRIIANWGGFSWAISSGA